MKKLFSTIMHVLGENVPDKLVDLIYLDPLFNLIQVKLIPANA